jgi:tetratricopeptide (TPR) repeat protein
MRAFVASEVLPTEAARLHAAFADRLASIPAIKRSPGELAVHWDAAGNEPRAFMAHVDAGLEAERAFAFAEAHRHLARALALWDHVADADDRVGLERLELAQHAAEAAALVGDLDRAIELASSILGQADEADADLLANVRSRLRWYLWQAGLVDEAAAEAERAVVASVGASDDRWRANAIAHLAGLRLQLGDVARARRGATDALTLAQALGAWQEAALAQGILGWCLIGAGHVEDGIEQIRAVWAAAHEREPHNLTGVALA